MDKQNLSERDICSKYITPALQQAWWDLQTQIREEVSFTKWRIKVRGKMISRWEAKRADYILYVNTLPIALIEAKDNKHNVGDGMQQGLDYAETLHIPFVYSSNGDAFLEHDRTKTTGTVERTLHLNEFPSPLELYEKYKLRKGIEEQHEKIITHPYYDDGSGKSPRYYQEIAINRTLEAVANKQDRILLVMATGTGKTYTAFQIIWRLWKAKAKKRILFLADRNILIDQTMVNDFKPFGEVMTKITNRTVDKSYEIYLALYQAITGTEEFSNIYKDFSADFFDLIVVDECHRGSAKENSARRDILNHFTGATQIGLTATPKETEDVSTSTYFGEPVYTYSLKQGIDDGFLAPYKVIKVSLNIDDERRPYKGQLDFYGNPIEDRIYNLKDYDKNIVIKERTEQIAKKITEFLHATDRYAKTIVFCVDIEHAERMRQALVNENPDLVAKDQRYVMRITGDEQEGKAQLDNFISPKETYPVIVTTSKLLTTWVDAQTCKVIVLDTNINSMSEFKQIIWRGTRLKEEYGKYYFTIIDFRKATNIFADPEFDGTPEVIFKPKEGDILDPDLLISEEEEENYKDDEPGWYTPVDLPGDDDDDGEWPKKILVDGVAVEIINERVQYIWNDGKLITESLVDYSKKNILEEYTSLDEFLNAWRHADKKEAIIEELEQHGILFTELENQVGKDLDPFDLICHVAFDQPALTRQERANSVKKQNYFAKYGEQARQVIDMLLDKYADQGIEAIEDINVLKVAPFTKLWPPLQIVGSIFGSKEKYMQAMQELVLHLYEDRVMK